MSGDRNRQHRRVLQLGKARKELANFREDKMMSRGIELADVGMLEPNIPGRPKWRPVTAAQAKELPYAALGRVLSGSTLRGTCWLAASNVAAQRTSFPALPRPK